jgi:hypothetical protein
MRRDDWQRLVEQRTDAFHEMRLLTERAEKEKRDLTADENAAFNRLGATVERLNPEIEAGRDELAAQRAEFNGAGAPVEYRNGARGSGLAEEFRSAGFPGETATVPWETFEARAVTWTGSADNINKHRAVAGPFGYDQRWAWPAFTNIAVDPGVTSVDVMTQTARTLATAANVVRAIDAVTAKPETSSTLTVVTTALHQVATIQTNVPNVYLEQPSFNTTIETDLTLAIGDGLDKLILDKIALSGFQAPGTDPLIVSVRKAMTTIMASGYSPDTLILTPANAETLDLAVSGITGGTQDFVFEPGQFAPSIFNLNRRISKTIPAPAVVDSQAFGKLYTSPVNLAKFEADGGTTNRSNVRMELHGVFGAERAPAAVRIAAS